MKISLLSRTEIEQLHQASLSILSRTGVHVPHREVLDLFQQVGAEVDRAGSIVKISEQLVVDSLQSAGKSFTLFGRDRTRKAHFGKGTRNYNTIFGEAHWVDDDMNRRFATLEDVRTAARFADALPWVNFVGSMSDPHEIPVEHRCVRVAAEMLKNTSKPIGFWFHDRKSAKYLLELFTIAAGSEQQAKQYPFTYPLLEPITPLRFPYQGLDLLFETCRQNIPVAIGPMAQTGATAPGTLAGTLALENAEILAGICIVQLVGPGTAVCYGGIPHALDMRTTQMIFAGPEQALMAVAMTEMGKYYGLPVYINVGLTDSKIPDAQAGIESGITLACGAMAGEDVFGHLGICGVDQASSLLMLTMQHEVIAYIERMMSGVEISEETLALDIIDQVGHGGNFLAEEHTARHFRNELWFPGLLDRRFFNAWMNDGMKDMRERCREMKREILDNHEPEPMDEDKVREIERLVKSAEKELAV